MRPRFDEPSQRLRLAPSKRWGFRLAAVILLPALLLCCIELVLRVVGIGYPTSFFLQREVAGRNVLVENDKFGWRFFGPDLARTPRPMEISLTKPARTCRVFVFGESAAYGDPKPEYGLPRFLEVLLQARFPAARFELVNVAMTGINSHVILPIARDCLPREGDVWVFYMGNNEVVGPYGSGTVFGKQTPPLSVIRGSLWLQTTRLGQSLAQGLNRRRDGNFAEWEGMAMFVNNQVRHDDARMPIVYSHFKRNLTDLIALGRKAGAKIVLSTVCSNLKDCPPFGSQHSPRLSGGRLEQWQQFFGSGKEAESANQFERAIEAFGEAAALDPDYAELQYRLGRCLLRTGNSNAALEHFVLARDYDTLRFRADSSLNGLIRETARAQSGDDLRFVDAERELSETGSIPGEELLYEHVHFNFHGNYRLSLALASQISALLPQWLRANAQPDWLTEQQCSARLAWTEWDKCRTLKSVLLRLGEAPFTGQCDHDQRVKAVASQVEGLLPSQKPGPMKTARAIYQEAVKLSPGDWVLQRDFTQLLRAQGDLPAAEQALRKSIELLPHNPEGHLELGLLLVQAHRPAEAIDQLNQVLQANPRSVPALNGLALAQNQFGKHTEAVATLEKALKIKPLSADTHLNLGATLESAGEKEMARQHYQAALHTRLTTPDLLVRAGKIAMSQGWIDQAITNLTRAAILNPADASVRYFLGGALDSHGDTAEAQKQFEEAVRIDPELAGAHLALGTQFSRQNRDAEAANQFQSALKADPGLLEARLRLGVSLLRQRLLDEAQTQFEQVLSAQPTNALAQKYLLLLARERSARQ